MSAERVSMATTLTVALYTVYSSSLLKVCTEVLRGKMAVLFSLGRKSSRDSSVKRMKGSTVMEELVWGLGLLRRQLTCTEVGDGEDNWRVVATGIHATMETKEGTKLTFICTSKTGVCIVRVRGVGVTGWGERGERG